MNFAQAISSLLRLISFIPTMTNLPELDDRIFQQLDRHDLTQCVRVNKTWHSIVLPHIWGDLTCLSYKVDNGSAIREAFGKMVVEDYRRVESSTNDDDMEDPPPPTHPSILANTGHLIRVLPNPRELGQVLSSAYSPRSTSTSPPSSPIIPIGHPRNTKERELLLHLFSHCPLVEIQYLNLQHWDLASDSLSSGVMEFVLPRVRELRFDANYGLPFPEIWKLQDILDRCSSVLKVLHLTAWISRSEEGMEDLHTEPAAENDMIVWTSLKELRLWRCSDESNSWMSWQRLWRRCSHVKKIDLSWADHTILQTLSHGMSTYMDNLDEIQLGMGTIGRQHLTDAEVASLLSACRKGWRVVRVVGPTDFGPRSMEVLRKHFSTLTELSVSGCSGDIGGSFVQALASGPSLHTMATFNVSDYEGVYPRIDAKAFIDRNPINGSFQTWQCETSLRVLMIKINGIPRPDLQGRTIREIYQGQGREIQGQVYDRLARLTNLETLWLGHLSSNMLSSALVEADKVSCLELSLESGLWRLGSLKSLKELSVSRMKTRIGVKEVQWMVEHWPKLRVIHGLDNTGDAKKAAVWLRENHPGVRLR